VCVYVFFYYVVQFRNACDDCSTTVWSDPGSLLPQLWNLPTLPVPASGSHRETHQAVWYAEGRKRSK